jgi:AbrB family looped-hinge helix DNA binding protein
MAHTSKLTQRGQTTIPSQIRRLLHAKPGDILEYEVTEQGVLVRVMQPDITKALDTYLGVFGPSESRSEEEALDAQREARGWDEHDPQLFKDWAEE